MILRQALLVCCPVLLMAQATLRDQPQAEEVGKGRPITYTFKEDKFSSSKAPLRVPGKLVKAVYSEWPEFPIPARLRRDQGDVLVEVWIDEAGVPIKAKTVWGLNILDKAAEKSALKWRFEPFLQEGRPIPVRFRIKFTFKVEQGRPYESLPARYEE